MISQEHFIFFFFFFFFLIYPKLIIQECWETKKEKKNLNNKLKKMSRWLDCDYKI